MTFYCQLFINVFQAIWLLGTSLLKASSQDDKRKILRTEVNTLWYLWVAVKCLHTHFFICKTGAIRSIHCEGSFETCLLTRVSKAHAFSPTQFLSSSLPLASWSSCSGQLLCLMAFLNHTQQSLTRAFLSYFSLECPLL